MSEKLPNCVRCHEEEPKVECSDCLSSKRKGEVASLCDACSELIHVGFLEEHDVQPIAIKLKKQEFKSQLELFKKYDQKLKFKQTEMGYAKQDIDARVSVTQRAIHEALGKVFQAMKDKEQELLGVVKESVAQKKIALSDCETKLTETVTKYSGILKETDGVLKAEPSEFMEICEDVEKKITDASILKIESSFPSLGPLPTIDITHLLSSVERVQLSDVDEGVDISLPDEPKSIEEGEVLEVFMESRMDTNGYFWVSRKMDAELNSILDNVSYQMREDIVLNPVEKVEITEGMVCCAQYQQDHRWYRAKVEQVKANQVGEACLYLRERQWYRALVEQIKPGQSKAHVRWLDYAHENEVPISHMYALKQDFQTIPFQAMHCFVVEDLEGEMPRPARWEFADHTGSTPLECTILKVDSEKQLYHVELKNKQKPDVDIKERLLAKMDGSAGKKDSIQCRDIRYMKDYTPPPASEIRAKQKQEREQRKGGKRGGKDKRSSQGQLSAEDSESGKSGRSTPDAKKEDKKTAEGQGDKKPDKPSSDDKPASGGGVSGSSGGDKSSGGGGGSGSGETVTVTKKSGEGGNTESSTKPSGGGEVNGKAPDTVKDDSQAPTESQPKDDNTTSIISTEAPALSNKTPVGVSVVGQDPSRGFVPISGQEKVPMPSVGGVAPYPSISIKEREAMVPSMQTFISSNGSGVAVSSVVTTTPPRRSVVDDEDERDRQLTERLAEQGDHGMAHNPDSASTLLPEVAQLFSTHSNLQQQGGVPLPGQIPGPMQGGYTNYPAGGYDYNMAGQMQSQHGYYYMGGPGRMHMGPQGMPLQQPGEMLPEHMHTAPEMVTRSPPPPYSREVEQAVPDSTTGGWDENSWNQSPARPSGPQRRMDDRTRYSSAAEEDSYRADSTMDMDDRSQTSSGQYGGSSPMGQSQDQRRNSDYRDNRDNRHHHHQQQQQPRQQQGRYGCYRCGDTGHQVRECHLPPQPGEGRSSGNQQRRRGGGRGGGGGGGGQYRKSNRGQRR